MTSFPIYHKVDDELTALRAENAARERRTAELTEKFDECEASLKEARGDMRANAKAEREQRVLEDMQRLFTGVHGRLVDLCQPSQQRFKVGVTVAMQAHLDSIVVDEERTAMNCIQYLKEVRRSVCRLTFVAYPILCSNDWRRGRFCRSMRSL